MDRDLEVCISDKFNRNVLLTTIFNRLLTRVLMSFVILVKDRLYQLISIGSIMIRMIENLCITNRGYFFAGFFFLSLSKYSRKCVKLEL